MNKHHPLVLIILDGWGYRKDTSANAIAHAHKPNWDDFIKHYPHVLISGSGRSVGLPEGQMGNSEVGHMTIGAGRLIDQDLTRIDKAIEDGTFFQNETFVRALQQAKQNQKAVHVMGLLSPGGVHSHENHLFALIKLAAQLNVPALYIHAFLDGRDTPPKSAIRSLRKLDALCKQLHCGQIVSLIGRYFAMDRDKRWDRIQKAYDLLTLGQGAYHAQHPLEALEAAYARRETDEFVSATSIHPIDTPPVTINDGDTVIFFNFRGDRAREITQAFLDKTFKSFNQLKQPQLGAFVSFAEYDPLLPTQTAYPPIMIKNSFPEYISKLGLKQLRIAETEKYAHVTFFFNGGREQTYPGEERLLIPSPKIATYDLQPEMSAVPLTERLIEKIHEDVYDVVICNFANPDMVGHTGNFDATVKAIETIDKCLGKIVPAVLAANGQVIITSDHGNAEQMFNPETNQPHTAHTSDPVPFIYIGKPAKIIKADGKLSDIAPTMLYLMNIPKPPEMTGDSLLKFG